MWNQGFIRSSRALFAAAKSATVTTKPSISTAASAKKTAAKTADKGTQKKAKPKPAKSPSSSAPSGIMKPIPVSLTLQGFVGDSQVSRVEAVKKIWAYIKDNNLQNPSNKKEIICDAKLKKLFNGKDKVGFLEIAKLLSPHFYEPAK